MSKQWDFEKKDCVIISFYPDMEGNGGALREQLIRFVRKGGHMNGNLLNSAIRKAEKLGARSFRMAILVPRVFPLLPNEDDL